MTSSVTSLVLMTGTSNSDLLEGEEDEGGDREGWGAVQDINRLKDNHLD